MSPPPGPGDHGPLWIYGLSNRRLLPRLGSGSGEPCQATQSPAWGGGSSGQPTGQSPLSRGSEEMGLSGCPGPPGRERPRWRCQAGCRGRGARLAALAACLPMAA